MIEVSRIEIEPFIQFFGVPGHHLRGLPAEGGRNRRLIGSPLTSCRECASSVFPRQWLFRRVKSVYFPGYPGALMGIVADQYDQF